MTAICILGMHRSGTSAITRGFNLLGAYLGEENDIVKPLPENPEGFWERFDIYYLQERLLSKMNRQWGSVNPLPENWEKSEEIRSFKLELTELIKNNFMQHSLWLWKDPRTCLLLPLWKDVLSEMNIALKVVFVVRNPLDVAKSLEKRNGFTTDKGLGIWFNNTLSALKEVAGVDTVFLSYDRFLEAWETELKKCAVGLGIAWPADETTLRAKLAPVVRHDLRHSVSGVEELHAIAAPSPVLRLYTLLLKMVEAKVELSAVTKMTADMYQEFSSYSRLFEDDMVALANCRTLLEEAATSVEMLPAFVEMKKELDSRTEWAWTLRNEVKNLKEKVASLQSASQCRISLRRLISAFSFRVRNGKDNSEI